MRVIAKHQHQFLSKELQILFFSGRMAVFNGVRHLGTIPAAIRTCGLIACPNDIKLCGARVNDLKTINFKTVRIAGMFTTETDKIIDMPSTLQSDLTPVKDYLFCTEKFNDGNVKIIMETVSPKELFSFGFYSRIYNDAQIYDGMRIRKGNSNESLSGDLWIYAFMVIVAVLIVISVIFIYVAQYTNLKLKIT